MELDNDVPPTSPPITTDKTSDAPAKVTIPSIEEMKKMDEEAITSTEAADEDMIESFEEYTLDKLPNKRPASSDSFKYGPHRFGPQIHNGNQIRSENQALSIPSKKARPNNSPL